MKDQFFYDFHYQIMGWEVVMNNQKSLGCMSIALNTMTHHVCEVLFE
jgi:ribosomal 30S subunit maturation factor RimM